MTMQQTIQEIRQQCRLAMNGVTSTSMREKGAAYKLNFGLLQEQIKRIASQHTKSSELAELLWKEDTRELKILATLLYPSDELSEEKAEQWLKEIPNQEIREQICLNLFQNVYYAATKGVEWANNPDGSIRTTGYWLLARLIMSKQLKDHILMESFNSIQEDSYSDNLFLRNAALLMLKHIGRQSKEDAENILNTLKSFDQDENPLKREAYNSLSFEFEFFFG